MFENNDNLLYHHDIEYDEELGILNLYIQLELIMLLKKLNNTVSIVGIY